MREGLVEEENVEDLLKVGVEIVLESKDDHTPTDVRFDIGNQTRDLCSGNGGDLAAEFFPSLCDQVLPHAFAHINAIKRGRYHFLSHLWYFLVYASPSRERSLPRCPLTSPNAAG